MRRLKKRGLRKMLRRVCIVVLMASILSWTGTGSIVYAAPKYSSNILGDSALYLKNGNMIAADDSGNLYYYDGKGIYCENTKKRIVKGVTPTCISIVNDYIYYVDANDDCVYQVKTSGSKKEKMFESGDYPIQSFYLSKQSYFLYSSNGRKGLMERFDISTGELTASVEVGAEKEQVAFIGNILFYVDGKKIYWVPMEGDWSSPSTCIKWEVGSSVHEICSDGSALYVLMDYYGDQSVYVWDLDQEDFTNIWTLGEYGSCYDLIACEGNCYCIRGVRGSGTFAYEILKLTSEGAESICQSSDMGMNTGLCIVGNKYISAYCYSEGTKKARLYYMGLSGQNLKTKDFSVK